MDLDLSARIERWPIRGAFTISRGVKTEATVVVAELSGGGHTGRGECVPYTRYGETVEGTLETILALAPMMAGGLDRTGLQTLLPPGAARNALDCAFWDLEAKRTDKRAWELAGLTAPSPAVTAYTISLDAPDMMAKAARACGYPLLKLKLGAAGDPERLRAIRTAVPDAALIVDANEGWRAANLAENLAVCAGAHVRLVEQPLPASDDGMLANIRRAVPVCADESAHDRKSLRALKGKYDAVNIKLDKAGGLTEALAMASEARAMGFQIMVGSMVSTSLGVAPAMLLAGGAGFIDLDGPLLLAKDRENGLRYEGALLFPPEAKLWG
jgi:L-alanine-DL-glutamate epimerase-like enolase superfamily enzyme